MIKKQKKGIAIFLLVSMLGGLLPMPVLAAETIQISDAKAFVEFAEQCTLDSWSVGKTVELLSDIDFNETSGVTVPIFNGTFEGNGHTLSELWLRQDGSAVGLFRYLGTEGSIHNLKVQGTITPGGSKSSVGGIVGENQGTITDCTFLGTVEGKSAVGGIAGKNTYTGEVRSCSVSGAISGELAVGGIVGKNEGLLLQCENHAAINQTYEQNAVAATQDVTTLDGDAANVLENYKIEQEESERNTLDRTDIGGIVGVTEGIVQGCRNYGTVGYQHRGYNVGGVAGRQFGYLLGCENFGSVYGRKDVGGIVGQAEPYLWLTSSQATLETIRAEFETLSTMADTLFADTDLISEDAGLYLDQLSMHADTAGDIAQAIKGQVHTVVEDNEAEIDAWTAELSNTIDALEAPLDAVFAGLDRLNDAEKEWDAILSILQKDFPEPEGLEEIEKGFSKLEDGMETIRRAKTAIETALGTLRDSIANRDKEAAQQALDTIRIQIDTIGTALDSMLSAARTLFSDCQDLLHSIDHAGAVIEHRWQKSMRRLEAAMEILSDAASSMNEAMKEIRTIVSAFAQKEPQFIKLGNDFDFSRDALFDTIGFLSDDLKELRSALENRGGTVKEDIRKISDQFEKTIQLLFDEVEDSLNGTDEDVFLDVSDQEIQQTYQGKIADSRNYGDVDGDRNAGGIVGAMSIDLAATPEADIEKPDSVRFTYRVKCVVQDCINEGDVLGRKDCVGGITGYGEMGTVSGCQNYGNAESVGGDYVGGIIGKCAGTIRHCYAKGTMRGGRYIGGIAGKADSLSDCYAIVTTHGEENCGAILGGTTALQMVKGNYFVNHGLGAIDGISYAGKGEPISYETMSTRENIPEKLIRFTVTFLADGRVVGTQAVRYGDATAEIPLPEVPPKKGYFGNWQPFTETVVTGDLSVECVYTKEITVVASVEKEENGKLPLALADGNFTDVAELHLYAVSEESEEVLPVGAVGTTVLYDVLLEDTGTILPEETMLRLLNAEKNTVSVWQKTDTGWKELPTKNNGKYAVCQMNGTEGRLCLRYLPKANRLLFLIPFGGVVLLAGSGILLKKRKQTQNSERKSEGTSEK